MPTRAAPTRTAAARRRRPIQLAALRGFEAAARRLSFTLAAEELSLTQSSISRQVAALERQVGKPLFVRRTRALELTAAGTQLLQVVARALQDIDGSVDAIRGNARRPQVSLTTYASFASLWLVPRLALFQREHAQIEIRIDASDEAVDLAAEGIDLALRRCLPAAVAGLAGVRPLCDELATPALSPRLLARAGVALQQPADLAQLPLIEMDDRWPSARSSVWARWFEHAGAAPKDIVPSLTFGFIDQAVQAAVRGQGVVMGRSPLFDDAVAAGELVLPFPQHCMPTGYRYYLLVQPARAAAPEVMAFARWLVEEFGHGPRRFE